MPTFREEIEFELQGYRLIAGIDEVGRGALAGPVVAGAVMMPTQSSARWLERVRDSKLLTARQREHLARHIQETAVSYGIGVIPKEIIDARGIAVASRLAMKQAIEQLAPPAEALLIDYFKLPEVDLPQKGIVDGDSLCFSIACASIIAKVARDNMMTELDATHPGYGFASHKGYSTREHLECLVRLGPCPIHRRSYAPVRDAETK